jgi:hypothetical protein
MKSLIETLMLSFFIFLAIECKKEDKDIKTVQVTVGKKEYIVNSKIDIIIKNDLNKPLYYLKCDNADLLPEIILEYENNQWNEIKNLPVCTQMGPMGYFGVIKEGETRKDTVILFNKIGKFKFRYIFIVDNDTLDFDSNEFKVHGFEM